MEAAKEIRPKWNMVTFSEGLVSDLIRQVGLVF